MDVTLPLPSVVLPSPSVVLLPLSISEGEFLMIGAEMTDLYIPYLLQTFRYPCQ